MGIIIWIVFGALVGWVASSVMGIGGELLSNIVVGIVGAVIGGAVVSLLGGTGVNGFTFYSFFVALLGACVFIWILRMVRH